jgi:phospholipid/cholesterol/gamma-HCH transport system ATP-binding protein
VNAPADQPVPAVRLEGVTKRFGDLTVLDRFDLEVARGTAVCLLGKSGTGKSVTLKHIVGLIRPDEGRIFVFGRETTTLTGTALSEVRRQIGFLFQNAALFDSISLGENVAFPMRRHTDWSNAEIVDRAQAKLKAVGLDGEYDKMPAALSGGMKKRAGLARAMALDPPLLLVDEPSAGLDPITSSGIDELLAGLKEQGTTLLVVTHHIGSARAIADRMVMLHEGRIVADGPVTELETSDHPLVHAFMHSSGGG